VGEGENAGEYASIGCLAFTENWSAGQTNKDNVVKPADAFKGFKRRSRMIAGKQFLVPFEDETPLKAFAQWLAACVALAIMLFSGVWLWRRWVATWVKYLVVAGFLGWEVLCFIFVVGAVAYVVLDQYFGKRR
jgi:hypothetical protein